MNDEDLTAQVTEVLDEIRQQLQAHEGDVELVEITDDGVVKVRLKGACDGCPMAQLTIKRGIEARLKQKVPAVTAVEPA